jgi:hypothetical protein
VQVVGRPCEICGERIASELDGVGCVGCERFFHDACLVAPPAEAEKPETYRAPAAGSTPKKKARKRKPRCPGCGVDLRAAQDDRNRATRRFAEAYEQHRRELAAGRGERYGWARLVGMLGLLVLLSCTVLVERCMHP